MIKSKTKTIGIIFILIIVGVLAYLLTQFSTPDVKSVETATSTLVANIPYSPMSISLNDWQTFSAQKNALKRDVMFSYTKELVTYGGIGGDSFANVTFDDTNKNSPAWTTPFTGSSTVMTLRGAVLLMRVSTLYPGQPLSKLLYDSLSFYPFVEVYKKSITLDGRIGMMIKRELTLPGGEKRIEYWAIFKDVDGTAYEFMMRGDIYSNSEEVFNKILQNLKWGAKPTE